MAPGRERNGSFDSKDSANVNPVTRISYTKELYAADAALTEAMDLSDVEMKCRALVHQMVLPVIDLCKNNLEHNASKNDVLTKIEGSIDDLRHRLSTCNSTLSSLPKLQIRVDNFEKRYMD